MIRSRRRCSWFPSTFRLDEKTLSRNFQILSGYIHSRPSPMNVVSSQRDARSVRLVESLTALRRIIVLSLHCGTGYPQAGFHYGPQKNKRYFVRAKSWAILQTESISDAELNRHWSRRSSPA